MIITRGCQSGISAFSIHHENVATIEPHRISLAAPCQMAVYLQSERLRSTVHNRMTSTSPRMAPDLLHTRLPGDPSRFYHQQVARKDSVTGQPRRGSISFKRETTVIFKRCSATVGFQSISPSQRPTVDRNICRCQSTCVDMAALY